MADTAKEITENTKRQNTRTVKGKLGANGALPLAIASGLSIFNEYDKISIQLTGTFNSSVQTIKVSNDGVIYFALPTSVSFSAAGYKTIAPADLGFKYMEFDGASAGGSSDIAFTVIATK